MSFAVRDGAFDVAIAAGPGVELWPSAGVRVISSFCAEMGLTVGIFGGESLSVRGIVPLRQGTGALLIVQDKQDRVHRIRVRALIRIAAGSLIPDSFPGWFSKALLPLGSAARLDEQGGGLEWNPCTVILGSGNRALRFGSNLIRKGVRKVICLETSSGQWGAKRFAGWEVERRQFEILGGIVSEGRPLKLAAKSPLLWEFWFEDSQGVKNMDVARVVSAGPFADTPGVREYPRGSFLFELEQTALTSREDDFEGWVLEEERARWLAARITKALVADLGGKRDDVQFIHRRARARLKRLQNHRSKPFTPTYDGKWLAQASLKLVREFSGVPKTAHLLRSVVSVECLESIACNICEKACPEGAIHFSRLRDQVLSETECTACGVCVGACPSGSILLIHEKAELSTSILTLPWHGLKKWQEGDLANLVNRVGARLGSGRVFGCIESKEKNGTQLVQIEVPTHLVWEARGLRREPSATEVAANAYTASADNLGSLKEAEVLLDGERRLARDGAVIAASLFEMGRGRPGDSLLCRDGSCGLCGVSVDGVKKQACQTTIHRGMSIRLNDSTDVKPINESALCPCLGIMRDEVIERIRQGKFHSPEAVLSATHVGEGRCHGRICAEPLRRLLLEQGFDVSQWIDWRFPWSDWVFAPAPHE